MTYNPLIPTGTVKLADDYVNIQQNFQALDTQFGVDHVPFSQTSGTPPNGYHTQLHVSPFSTTTTNRPNNQPVAAPTATAGYGQLWSANINDGINADEALYWLTGGNRSIQLTRNIQPVITANGYTCIPGGLIVQWGRITGLSGSWPTSEQTLTFATANISFASTCLAVWTTFIGPTSSSGGDISINSVSNLDFIWQFGGSSGASFDGFYWLAIGV